MNDRQPPRAARRAVTVVFLVFGAVLGTWVSRIPLIKDDLGLSEGTLGVALLGAPIGSTVLAMAAVTPLARRFGTRAVTRVLSVLMACALVPPALAPNLLSLMGVLVLLGFCQGCTDITMNAQGVAVERRYGRPILSGMHGWFSIGLLSGTGAGALLAGWGVPPLYHFAGAAVLLGATAFTAGRWLLDSESADGPREGGAAAKGPRPRLLDHPILIVLGVIGLCSFLGEGAVDDWSGVYLHEVLHAGLGTAPLASSACAIAMAGGRLGGDWFIGRFGPVTVLRASALLGAAGMAIALLSPSPWVAICGYFVFGLGTAPVAPIAFSASGHTAGAPSTWAISRVTTLGYSGLMAGPPLIGLIAHGVGLTAALSIPLVLSALILPLSRAVRTSGRGAAAESGRTTDPQPEVQGEGTAVAGPSESGA